MAVAFAASATVILFKCYRHFAQMIPSLSQSANGIFESKVKATSKAIHFRIAYQQSVTAQK